MICTNAWTRQDLLTTFIVSQVRVVGSHKRDGNVYTLDYTHLPTKGGAAGVLEGIAKVGPEHKVALACVVPVYAALMTSRIACSTAAYARHMPRHDRASHLARSPHIELSRHPAGCLRFVRRASSVLCGAQASRV